MFHRLRSLPSSIRHHPLRAFLVIVVLVGAGGLAIWQIRAEVQLRAARRDLERGHFREAQAHLAACLQAWPRNRSPDLLLLAARTARRAGSFEEAERYLDASERLQAASESIQLERVLLAAQRGRRWHDVEDYLQSCLRQDHPDTCLILEVLIQGYIQGYRFADAMDCCNQLLERQPNHTEALAWRAWVWKRGRRSDKALEDYRRALDIDPDFDTARLRLAETLLADRLGTIEEALDHLERLRQRQPENPAVLVGLARCYQGLDRTEEARRLLDQVLAHQPHDVQALLERGRLALNSEGALQAEPLLRQAAARAPHNRTVVYLLAQCLQLLDKKDEAQKCTARVAQIDSDLKRLEDLVKQTADLPHDPRPRHEIGLLLLSQGKDQEALHWFSLALREDPRHRPTHRALAEYYQRMGDPVKGEYHASLAH